MKCEIKNCKTEAWTRIDFDPSWGGGGRFYVSAGWLPSSEGIGWVGSCRVCKKHHHKIRKQIAKLLGITKYNDGRTMTL